MVLCFSCGKPMRRELTVQDGELVELTPPTCIWMDCPSKNRVKGKLPGGG